MWLKLLALLDAVSRLLDWAGRIVKRAERHERERRHEEIDSDPAGEFIDKFGGVRDDERTAVPGDNANTESSEDRDERDSVER